MNMAYRIKDVNTSKSICIQVSKVGDHSRG